MSSLEKRKQNKIKVKKIWTSLPGVVPQALARDATLKPLRHLGIRTW